MDQKKKWHEKLYCHLGQYFLIEELLYKKKTAYQKVMIFKNSIFGKVMVIDDIVQTTERDEFIYHEMLTHVPIFSHGSIKNVLIIGGGDGGILREVCRHKNIENITMVEIDIDIINLCKKYFPNHSKNAYQDSRLKLIIDDGLNFTKKTKEKFDLIISDSTDPVSCGKNLFLSEFYFNCKNCLNKNGIFVAQNGVFFLQKNESILTYKNLKKHFCDTRFYQANIPTYYGGIMIFAWGSNNTELYKNNLQNIKSRIKHTKLAFNYYNAKIHMSSFYLPQYILNILDES
ncbi:polyamine aminopropyltransferase [Buchnera aphidicola (Sitobion avenae)]|uniref:Polyamine aminopropyltransferase n=1 Tax=Buchnera aphidicola (Sitobion avenae) TaxID=571428 RepID=A0A4D6Y6M1_9GAMM|nr:polyamine aminopropyltransferase [Buchnera aphidicola]MCU4137010.1 polyamine aminopropyltransferase [Buchnera aphidicola (Sitobion miscanthi)]QCI25426.1 polyamine aminopropyltransferase [Buchnera aphidicola (Sitobion avenae)]